MVGSSGTARSAAWIAIAAALLAGCATTPAPRMATAPMPEHGFVDIALGDTHLCGRTVDGQVACWGSHHAGQLGLAGLAMRTLRDGARRQETPRGVPLPGRALALVAAAHHTCAHVELADATRRAVCWGEGQPEPTDLGHDDVQAVATGRDHVCVLRDTGLVSCHGWDPDRTDAPEAPAALEPLPDVELDISPDLLLASSDAICAAARDDGQVTCWSPGRPAVALPETTPFEHVAIGSSTVCTLDAGGELRCWQLLDLDPPQRPPRVQPPTVEPLGAGATGLSVSRDRCALYPSSAVACAERNPLSTTLADPYAIAPDVLNTPGLLDLDARLGWGCAVTATGQAHCWADDERAWRLGARRATLATYTPGLECPAELTPELTPERWACLDDAGRRQGLARHWWPDRGRLQAEGHYRDDVRVGPWTELDVGGRMRSTGAFVDGLRDGVWVYTGIDPMTGLEHLAAEGTWAGGVQVGSWRWPHEGRTMTLSDTGQPVAWAWVFPTGTTWQLRRDDTGQWWREQLDDDGGVVASVHTTEPVHTPVWGPTDGPTWPGGHPFDGDYQGLHDDGRVQVTGTFVADRPHGTWSAVDVDGPLRWEGAFDQGRPTGPWRAWHPGERLALSGEFAAPGVPDGRWRRWHGDGQLAVDGHYDQGTMVGTWTWFDGAGDVVHTLEFEPRLADTASTHALLGAATRYDAATGAPLMALGALTDATSTTSARPPTLVEEVEARVDLEPWLDAPGTLARSSSREDTDGRR